MRQGCMKSSDVEDKSLGSSTPVVDVMTENETLHGLTLLGAVLRFEANSDSYRMRLAWILSQSDLSIQDREWVVG